MNSFSLEEIHSSWHPFFSGHIETINNILSSLDDLLVTPKRDGIFRAFTLPLEEVKVVIFGQDPYPGIGVADGLAFSTSKAIPASLRNIFTELATDVGGGRPQQTLLGWQEQGVLLLNRHLTTLVGQPGAHIAAGWEAFTEFAIRALMQQTDGLVLVLWGNHAQTLRKKLGQSLALAPVRVIASAHPSPLSAYRGFFGSRPFSAINVALVGLGKSPINWNL